MPAYESALKALATLDKKSVQEMKGFTNPPEMVKFTLEAVCILLEVKPGKKRKQSIDSHFLKYLVLGFYDLSSIKLQSNFFSRATIRIHHDHLLFR